MLCCPVVPAELLLRARRTVLHGEARTLPMAVGCGRLPAQWADRRLGVGDAEEGADTRRRERALERAVVDDHARLPGGLVGDGVGEGRFGKQKQRSRNQEETKHTHKPLL
jgi:hypothetical protein